jgi:NitT/TauT family transport system permease protein
MRRLSIQHPGLIRLALLVALVILLEILCRFGVIDALTMQPPHRMLVNLVEMLVSGRLNLAILRTLANALAAFAAAMVAGTATAFVLHRLKTVRATLDPFFATYYAVPVFAFYPLLIILFGLGDMPEIVIGFMLAVIAVIVSVLSGLDHVPRVMLKVAHVHGFGGWETVWRITLPCVAPYVLTGAKLALAYALIGVIGAEFIMSTSGMGYEISFAYTNFDNATMYPLIILIILVAVGVNALLGRWERTLMVRRGLA